jgi:hypothetical protein
MRADAPRIVNNETHLESKQRGQFNELTALGRSGRLDSIRNATARCTLVLLLLLMVVLMAMMAIASLGPTRLVFIGAAAAAR